MKRILCILLVCGMVAVLAPTAQATNGDNLIAVGPIARAMGGVGIAAPQDAISAVFSNPAAMCFGPYCPGSEVNFAGTLFMPSPEGKITIQGVGVIDADSDEKVYAIPAFGLSVPINPKLRFGLAAFGVSGLGVDYRDTAIEDPTFFDFSGVGAGPFAPLASGEYTQLQIMKFSPNIAYLVNDKLSVGLGVHIIYSSLDFRNGSSFNYGAGVQVGAIYKATDMVSLGVTYQSPQSVDHKNVLAANGQNADLKLESPQEVGVGVAFEPLPGQLLLEVDGKWVNWSGAKGYEDFGWDDQFVVAVGGQYKPVPKLALRLGYNYAKNPVDENNGWDGSFGVSGPNDVVMVQGTPFPRYYYETFRIIGFPAIVQHHITGGVGYEFTNNFAMNLAYTHAFSETLTESGTDPFGRPVALESQLSENSLEFGVTWRF
ncbi:MAG: outer membrane protein transport protein [Nitrospirota bacterium]